MNVSYLFLAPGFEEMEAIAVVDIHWNKFDRKRLNA